MADPLKVYLGGPEVFLPNAIAVYEAKIALCGKYGFAFASPFDVSRGDGSNLPPGQLSRATYEANIAAMREADFGIFSLTPFRGASADVGTVFEVGFMTGLGKPVFGYTGIDGDYLARIAPRQRTPAAAAPPGPPGASVWRDADGFSIEDFGNADNLMIDEALRWGDGALVRHDATLSERFADLTPFEKCLELARKHFGPPPTA
jgi:nucleoside 2-deoxyribosyltransferase